MLLSAGDTAHLEDGSQCGHLPLGNEIQETVTVQWDSDAHAWRLYTGRNAKGQSEPVCKAE